MTEATGDRLTRLLAMVTYLADRDGATVAELAAHFGVSEAQVLRDVDTLWVSGTPGYQPDDLLDFSADAYDERYIALTNARGMDRPLRLDAAEAVSLVVALRALRALPGMASPAVDSALRKLTLAAGDAAPAEDAVAVAPAVDAVLAEHVSAVLETARQALAGSERLAITYVSASDETTRRVVEPLELTSDGEHWYLRAWCLLADGVRHFRLDRVVTAVRTGEPVSGSGREAAEMVDRAAGARPVETSFTVALTLTPRSRWVAERFEGRVRSASPRAIAVELDVADPAWLDRLVLDLGPEVLALDPADHAVRVAERARLALALYAGTPDAEETP